MDYAMFFVGFIMIVSSVVNYFMNRMLIKQIDNLKEKYEKISKIP